MGKTRKKNLKRELKTQKNNEKYKIKKFKI